MRFWYLSLMQKAFVLNVCTATNYLEVDALSLA